ncbi:MAG: AAA family ATPase [Thermoplasmata archaeon]|nr:AAA family ATPase [Thermoplasmata archaeon]NIS12472.1 AAA family ATPase [Thermoplasmata archaeon]NIS20391.1 AAA family ATPase [Thermoplasmata archaeon]NIT77737.1 AAA family ATPase [Thermoplasmata archaeon]NIU49478.1 AAA family ATPase [Thermoplasmata archaeon]
MIITLGGLPGSGKTTVARILADKLKMEYINAGDIFRNLASKKGMTLEEFGFFAERNPNIDKAIDKKLLEIARRDNVILEGRLAGIMLELNDVEALKVWLEAPLEVRVERISGRDSKSTEAAMADTQMREKSEWDRYYNIYHVDIRDLGVYNLVIQTQDRTPEDIANEIIEKYEEAQKGK